MGVVAASPSPSRHRPHFRLLPTQIGLVRAGWGGVPPRRCAGQAQETDPMTQTLHASPGAAVDPIFAPPVITGTSSKEALDILFHALLDVARRHEPELEAVLHGHANISEFTP